MMHMRMTRPTALLLIALTGTHAPASDVHTSTSFTPIESAPVSLLAMDDQAVVLVHELPLRLVTHRPNPASEFEVDTTLTLPGNRFTRLAQADINGDGHADLAILSSTERLIHLLMNQGDGTFLPAAKSPYPTPSLNSTAFAFGDLDGMGIPDLLLGAQAGLVRYPVIGEGELGFPAVIAPGIYGHELLVADFKGTDQSQIAVIDGTNIRLLERSGDAYQPTLNRSLNGTAFRMVAGNPLLDGRVPILIARTESSLDTLTYSPNNNSFSTVTSAPASAGSSPTDACFADVNADGVPDLIMGYAGSLLLRTNLSDASSPTGYAPTPAIGYFYGLRHVAVLDINGDGLQDTIHATANPPGLITFLQHAEHGFSEYGTTGPKPGDLYRFLRISTPNEPASFFLPHFTNSQNRLNQQATILPGNASPIIQTTDLEGPAAAPVNTRWMVADLNNDGHPDLVEVRRVPSAQLTSPVPHALFYHLSLTDGSFANPVSIPFTGVYNMGTPVVADFNADGIDDVAVMDAYGLVFFFFGATSGEIAPPTQFQFIPHPGFLDGAYGALMAADLDGDEHIDLIGANRLGQGSAVYVAYGLGGGQFEQPVSMPAPPNAGGQISPAQATGDLNNDGVLDIAITGTYQAVIYLSEGPRVYTAAQQIAADPAPQTLFITDFNADGLHELVLAFRGNTEVVHFEDGQPSPDRTRFLSPDGVQAIHFEDFTGNGLPDMLISSSGGLSMIYNQTSSPSACPADINSDGMVNFFDLAAYIALYNVNDPNADLAAPFGTLNFFDLAAYIALYNAGCP